MYNIYGVKIFMDKIRFRRIVIIFFIFCVAFLVFCLFYAKFNKKPQININTEVIQTNSNTTIRVINTFDESMFKHKNTALIMWATWCKNCEEELQDLKNILDYSTNTDLQIILIAHEYEKQDLIDFVENEMDFGCEIYLDLKRTIRHNIDKDEDSIPVTYFLDKKCNVLNKHRGPISFEEFKNLTTLSYDK